MELPEVRHSLAIGGVPMIIGDRLRALREQKKLSQGDIEEKTGLLRCYISRVENGHTVPTIETLEKLARALEIPMYQLFFDGDDPIVPPILRERKSEDVFSSGKGAQYWSKLSKFLAKSSEKDRKLVLHLATKTVAMDRLRKA
jgi:transcriptional regulator with XRE-family HTH domain